MGDVVIRSRPLARAVSAFVVPVRAQFLNLGSQYLAGGVGADHFEHYGGQFGVFFYGGFVLAIYRGNFNGFFGAYRGGLFLIVG